MASLLQSSTEGYRTTCQVTHPTPDESLVTGKGARLVGDVVGRASDDVNSVAYNELLGTRYVPRKLQTKRPNETQNELWCHLTTRQVGRCQDS
ncbi:hypothetical protein HAX54_007234 [Datura stramonium]|uniref:Uncharacterized protein n=1 Tax=Datura stramonium TaxID=4076 RepID=A0ABS8TBF0_DATST|nr:hypothetical protein [Datura stramonium]